MRRLLIVPKKLAETIKFKTDFFSMDPKIDHYIAVYQGKIESLKSIMDNLRPPSDVAVDVQLS